MKWKLVFYVKWNNNIFYEVFIFLNTNKIPLAIFILACSA